MFSLSQLSILKSAKAEGEAWYEYVHDQVLDEIQKKIQDADLFNRFRKALFNDREPVVYIDIEATKITNHPCCDPVDVHELLLKYDGYNTIADGLDGITLSYKVSTTSGEILLKLQYDASHIADPPAILRIATPPLPASDDEEVAPVLNPEDSPIARRLEFPDCCDENGPCTGCYLQNAADEEGLTWDKEYRRNGPAGFPVSAQCVYPGCGNRGVNGGYCESCEERDEVYDDDDRNKASTFWRAR